MISRLLSSSLVFSCLLWSSLVFSCLVLSCLLLSSLVFSCLLLSCLLFSCLLLSCLLFSSLLFSSLLSSPLLSSSSSPPSLSPCLRVVLPCLLLSTTSVSSFHFNQFVVQGLGSIKPMAGVTTTAPLSHEELKIDYEALDEQSPSVAKQGPSGQKKKCRSNSNGTPREAGMDRPCKRSRSSGSLELQVSPRARVFFWSLFDPS